MMILRRLATVLVLVCAAFAAQAQDVRTVSGEYTFYGDGSHTPKECKRMALEGARLAAMAREFGTTVTQSIVSDEIIKGDKENTFFRSLSETQVKGEWIEDIGEPQYTVSLDNDGNMMVTCKVRGRAREISNDAPEFTAAILRNGTDMRAADTRFRSGDQMRLYFRAPVDGYLAVYLCGEDRMAYTMLPYSGSPDGYVKVRHGQEYLFFDPVKTDPAHGEVDEMLLVTDQPVERDTFYILFSPQKFVKANDSYSGEGLPRSLPFNEFHRWLSKTRKNDPSLGLQTIDITINGEM
ncbi:MAG: DUF4384 domain-containing protein [Muribaculaceae bacterium]|nr:DUF4384 domain-containing protein [Muribaculaceae bacterium]